MPSTSPEPASPVAPDQLTPVPAEPDLVVQALRESGGVASRAVLLRRVRRGQLTAAVTAGDVVRDARGRYALADAEEWVRTASRLAGVLGLTSAALRHGWAVKTVPGRPDIMLSRGRKVADDGSATIHRAELAPEQVAEGMTTPEVTLAHCLRRLPFDEALAIADSALREGFPRAALERIAAQARGPGSPQMRRVAREATAEAANPFESVLRAIALDVPGLRVEPQVVVREPGITARPDLADVRRRVLLEADSFAWHGDRAALRADARRYDLLVVSGWIVLRFAWEHVMLEPEFVRRVLLAVVTLTDAMSEVVPAGRRAA